MKQHRSATSSLWLFALGIVLLWLLKVPQLSLNKAYHLILFAALNLLGIQVLLRYSLSRAAFFAALMAVFGWLMESSETAMLPFNIAAAVVMLSIVNGDRNVYLRVLWGSLAGSLILACGTAALPLWRKEGELMASILYGLSHQWQPFIAGLIGALCGAYLYKRRQTRS